MVHGHFPHLVTCRPIDAEALLKSNGFKVIRDQDLELWTLPVAARVAIPDPT